MTGNVGWDQLIFLVGLLVIVGAGVGVFVWRVSEHQKKERHDLRSHYEQRLFGVKEQFEDYKNAIDPRLRALETFDAGLTIILKHLDANHAKLDHRFDALEKKREDDMRDLHARLEAIMREQIRLRNEENLRQ